MEDISRNKYLLCLKYTVLIQKILYQQDSQMARQVEHQPLRVQKTHTKTYPKNVDTFKISILFNSLCVWIWLMITWLYFGITVSICPCIYLCYPCLRDLSREYVLNHSTFCNQTLYWAIQRSWFARVNAVCNLSRKKSREVTAHFWADFWVGVASHCV